MKAKRIIAILFCIIPVMFSGLPAAADPFQEGNTRTWVSIGRGEAFRDDYLLLGMGFGYFPVDQFEIGVEAEYWLGGSPYIQKIGLQTQYIIPVKYRLKPCAGIFYRYAVVSAIADMKSYGFRGGVYANLGETVVLGCGIAHEIYLSGDAVEFSSYGGTYPEITVSVVF